MLAIKYKDGIMMAADTLGAYSSTPPHISPHSHLNSILRLSRPLQIHPTSPLRRIIYCSRRIGRPLRLPIYPKPPRRTHYRRIHRRRPPRTRPYGDSRVPSEGAIQSKDKDEPTVEFVDCWGEEGREEVRLYRSLSPCLSAIA